MVGTESFEKGGPRPKGLVTSHEHYLNVDFSVKSWLLTTDHKRIGLLYLVSITAFFVLGGIYAMLIRLELLTPQADVLTGDMYNKVFTLHGFIMIFFFLVPLSRRRARCHGWCVCPTSCARAATTWCSCPR
jgi:cytochrome c oxidase subunit 1